MASDPYFQEAIIKPTKRRYLILALYSICSLEKSFQWINLSTITDKVALFYNVSNVAVNWTSVLFMITFIPLVLPTGWLIERIGLRKAILIGSIGITLGAIIKCFSCQEDRFWLVIVGQIIVSLSEQFIFCVPARIASVWFPDNQVSFATGCGIFGNQCGIALGFLIPQIFLKGLETKQDIGIGLYKLFLWTAVVASITLLILLAMFDDAPKHAPGAARLRKIADEMKERETRGSLGHEMRSLGALIKQLVMSDKNCLLLVIAYGINVGSGYAIQTCLNQIIKSANWKNSDKITGYSGNIVIVSGMAGALIWGHLCDRTHKYILINRILYANAIIGIGLLGLTLEIHNEPALYLASCFLGFHLIGYTVCGLDTVVELTYPAPELISTSIMNLSPQIFGTFITFAASKIADEFKSDACCIFLISCLLIGMVVMMGIRERLNRQMAVIETKESRLNVTNSVVASDRLEDDRDRRPEVKVDPTIINLIQSNVTAKQ